MPAEEWRKVLSTNLDAVFFWAQEAASRMLAAKTQGAIVNIASVLGLAVSKGAVAYATAKAGVVQVTKALAVEVAPRGITVNAVAPGVIETEMSRAVRELAGDELKERILLRRYGGPQEVANAVWFLASGLSGYVTGQVLHVDGGFIME
jgi:3-oxoacyl-[acyl-carrier protein] reductase